MPNSSLYFPRHDPDLSSTGQAIQTNETHKESLTGAYEEARADHELDPVFYDAKDTQHWSEDVKHDNEVFHDAIAPSKPHEIDVMSNEGSNELPEDRESAFTSRDPLPRDSNSDTDDHNGDDADDASEQSQKPPTGRLAYFGSGLKSLASKLNPMALVKPIKSRIG